MGWALALIAVAAWVLRFEPLTRGAAAFGYPIDYDEGVYFSASALFFQGHWPYRDFAFVHPPGGVWLWGPAALTGSWLGVDTGFTVAGSPCARGGRWRGSSRRSSTPATPRRCRSSAARSWSRG
jgi:hypothetical protein